MEDFGYQRNSDHGNFSSLTKKIFLIVATLFSLSVFAYITVNAYYFVYNDEDADIQTIKSPKDPIKVIADDKDDNKMGAMKIDHSIYEDIFGNKKETSISKTKVRKAPEPPLPPKEIVQKIEVKEEAEQQKDQQKIIVYGDSKKEAKDFLTKISGEKRDNSAAPEKKISDKRRPVRVQVAAMTSKESAKNGWKLLERTYPGLFDNLKPYIEKVDLGKRGVFYRLQVGDFFNQIEAEEFCNRYVMKAKKSRADCIIVE